MAIGQAEGKNLTVNVNGADYQVELENAPVAAPAAPVAPVAAAPAAAAAPAPAAAAAPAGAGEKVNSPLPGVIVEVCVKEGQAVKAGQKLAVLEAMKMENEILSPADGTIIKVNCEEGKTVATRGYPSGTCCRCGLQR